MAHFLTLSVDPTSWLVMPNHTGHQYINVCMDIIYVCIMNCDLVEKHADSKLIDFNYIELTTYNV